ncbi:hypothetical protein BJD99_04540 [Rhodococcus sp. 1163]|nr:hypothetical protein BJD99_04540 [Rhodococcus sp. 1163]
MHTDDRRNLVDIKNKIVAVAAVALASGSIGGGIAAGHTLDHAATPGGSSVVDTPEAGDTPDAPGSVDLPESGDVADAPGQ